MSGRAPVRIMVESTYKDPEIYVPRYIVLDEKEVEVSSLVAERLLEEGLYVVWGLPGSGKTTIAREVARRLFWEGYPSLHIIFKYENRLLLSERVEKGLPPAVMVDVSAMTGEKISKLSDVIIRIAKGYPGSGDWKGHVERIASELELILEGSGGRRCENVASWVRTLLAAAYLVGVINIDISDFIRCNNLRSIPPQIRRLLKTLARKRRGPPARGLLVILDNIDSQDRTKIEVARRFIAEIRERLTRSEGLELKQLYVYTITESEYAHLRVSTSIVDHIEALNSYIAEKLGLPLHEVVGRVLPSPIPYPLPEELQAIARANGIEVRGQQLDRIRRLAACSGWHISLILNMLRLEQLKGRTIEECALTDIIEREPGTRDEAVNIIRRFLTLSRLVRELIEVDLAFLGILAQPMGVSCVEIEALCKKLFNSGRLPRPLRPLIPPVHAGRHLSCSFSTIRSLVEEQEWMDILSLFHEDLCSGTVISVKVGGYFYHLPDLLSELERGGTLELLRRLMQEYYKDQAGRAVKALEKLVGAMQYVRARLLEIHREMVAAGGCTGSRAGQMLECVED